MELREIRKDPRFEVKGKKSVLGLQALDLVVYRSKFSYLLLSYEKESNGITNTGDNLVVTLERNAESNIIMKGKP